MNPRPKAYESSALPLSYSGEIVTVECPLEPATNSYHTELVHTCRMARPLCHSLLRRRKFGNMNTKGMRAGKGGFKTNRDGLTLH